MNIINFHKKSEINLTLVIIRVMSIMYLIEPTTPLLCMRTEVGHFFKGE